LRVVAGTLFAPFQHIDPTQLCFVATPNQSTDTGHTLMTDPTNPSDEESTKSSPDGITINLDQAKALVHGLVADVAHAIKHNAPTAPSVLDRLKQALTHLGG
jgi:hypothetical protein